MIKLAPAISFCILFLGLFLFTQTTILAQSALDGFDPNANNIVRVVLVQPDGKILLGGDFTSLAPNGGASVTRNRIARLNHDGTLDTGFNPNANGVVHTIALQADGKILVGGNFNGVSSIGGQSRNRIARLDAVTGLADSFDPSADNSVFTIAVQADGNILAGGNFTSIGGQTRNRIARLDAVTGLADSFEPNANSSVFRIVVQPDGKVLVGGSFITIGGQTRNRMARLDSVTGLADTFDPNASSSINTIALQADGKILVGGSFNGVSSIGGQTRNHIARLDATTGLPDSFNPNANGRVNWITVQPDSKILAGGQFTNIGGQARNYIGRISASTGLADSFDPKSENEIYAIGLQEDGKMVVGGSGTTFAPNGGSAITRNRIARLEINGGLDKTLDLNISNIGSNLGVYTMAVQPDGKIVIGGLFNSVLGVTRNHIARLNPDGTLDTGFNPNASDYVHTLAVQPDGKILAGGQFATIGGQTRNRIARLDAVTGAADSWNPNLNNTVYTLAVQEDGKVVVGGFFTTVGAQTRNRIARLDETTGAADSFNPNANGFVRTLAIQSDGKILAGGDFSGASSIGGQTRNRIARLDAVTGLADSFDPDASATVYSIVVQPDGNILVGGDFNGVNSIGGQTRNRIARLDATTGLADPFDPNASGTVRAMALQSDGKIVMSGSFTNIGGQARSRVARVDGTTGLADSFDPNADGDPFALCLQADGKILVGGRAMTTIGGETRYRFARLNNPTAATQELAVTQTAVTWSRGGSSAKFTRVTFEDSTDGVNYDYLGEGTASGSNWTLTGLNLSIQQNLYIRARGFNRTGYGNSSEGIQESVRNAFLIGPTPTSTSTPTASPSPTNTFTPTATSTATGTVTPTATATPITLLDTVTNTSGAAAGPFTYMGNSWTNNTLPGGTNSVQITRVTIYVASLTTQSYNNVVARLQFWNNYLPASNPVFNTPAGAVFTTSLGAQSFAENQLYQFDLVLPTPITLQNGSGWNWGFAQNFQGDTGSGPVDTANLTSAIAYGGAYAAGQITNGGPPDYGVYATSSGTSFNFAPADFLTQGPSFTNQGVAIIIYGNALSATPTATNTPTATATNTATNTATATSTATSTPTPGCGTTVSYTGPVVAIPDNNPTGVNITLPVSGVGIISDLNFRFDTGGICNNQPGDTNAAVDHPFLSDLIFKLTSPVGNSFSFQFRRGGAADNICLTNFNDEGGFPSISTLPTNNGSVESGNFSPEATGMFSDFDGHNADGNWILNVSDNEGGDIGSARRFSLIFNSEGPCGTPTPTETPTISGTITYGNAIGNPAPPRFVKNVSVVSTSGTPAVGPVITGTPGTYTLTGFGAGSYTIKPTKPGGSNGAITSNDAARVAQGVVSSPAFVSQNQRFAADTSGNGNVTSNDAALIARFAAGLTGAGNAGQWKFFVTGAPSPLPTAPQTYDDSRTYASVTSSLTGEDYVAILVGEVSGNWNPATHPRPAGKVNSEDDSGATNPIMVTAQHAVTPLDKEIIIPVTVQGAADKGVISYEFDLRYDPTVIQPLADAVDVAGTVSRGLFVVANPYEPGLLRIVVYGPMPIDENGLLLNLRFTAVGAAGSASPLTFERIMFNEGEPSVMITDGHVELF